MDALKNKFKKSFVVALIAPMIATGCASNGEGMEEGIKTNLTPINQFFRSFAFSQCDKEITMDDYKDVLHNKVSGVYGNPLNSDCVPISFNSPEKPEFYEQIVDSAQDKDTAKRIVDHILNQGFDKKDDMAVTKIPLSDGRFAQIVKYTGEGIRNDTRAMLARGGDTILKLDEFFFLHELFHLSDMNYDNSISQNIRETNSDIPALIVLNTQYNMSITQIIEMTKQVKKFRVKESKNRDGQSHTTHMDRGMMDKFLNYLHELERTGIGLERVHSFKHALAVGDGIALEIDRNDRNGKTAFNYYWDIGMGMAENDIPTYEVASEEITTSIEGLAVENSINIENKNSAPRPR